MTWREFYHWATTSRYTRRLEREIDQLKADNDRLRADNDVLLKTLYPAIKAARTEYDAVKEVQKVQPIHSFRW